MILVHPKYWPIMLFFITISIILDFYLFIPYNCIKYNQEKRKGANGKNETMKI